MGTLTSALRRASGTCQTKVVGRPPSPIGAKHESLSMKQLATPKIWFVCGSQHLYGPGPLEEVARHAREVAETLDASELQVDYRDGVIKSVAYLLGDDQ